MRREKNKKVKEVRGLKIMKKEKVARLTGTENKHEIRVRLKQKKVTGQAGPVTPETYWPG